MRPLLGEEKEISDEVKHVNIQSEKNLELIKSGANESIAGGLNKNMKYDFEFDRYCIRFEMGFYT